MSHLEKNPKLKIFTIGILVLILSFLSIFSTYILNILSYNYLLEEVTISLQKDLDRILKDYEGIIELNAQRLGKNQKNKEKLFIRILKDFEYPLILDKEYLRAKSIRFFLQDPKDIIYNKYGRVFSLGTKVSCERISLTSGQQIITFHDNEWEWYYPVYKESTKEILGVLLITFKKKDIIKLLQQRINQNFSNKQLILKNIKQGNPYLPYLKEKIILKVLHSKEKIILILTPLTFLSYIQENSTDLGFKILLYLSFILVGWSIIRQHHKKLKGYYDKNLFDLSSKNKDYSQVIQNIKKDINQLTLMEKHYQREIEIRDKLYHCLLSKYRDYITTLQERAQIISGMLSQPSSNPFQDSPIIDFCHHLISENHLNYDLIIESFSEEKLELTEIIDNCIMMLMNQIMRDKINVKKINFKKSYKIQNDWAFLMIIIYNTLRIALNRCFTGGEISIIISFQKESFVLTITDNGYAFDESKLSSLAQTCLDAHPLKLDLNLITDFIEKLNGKIKTTHSSSEKNKMILSFSKNKPVKIEPIASRPGLKLVKK